MIPFSYTVRLSSAAKRESLEGKFQSVTLHQRQSSIFGDEVDPVYRASIVNNHNGALADNAF